MNNELFKLGSSGITELIIVGEARSQATLFSEYIDNQNENIHLALLIQSTICTHPATTGSPPYPQYILQFSHLYAIAAIEDPPCPEPIYSLAP